MNARFERLVNMMQAVEYTLVELQGVYDLDQMSSIVVSTIKRIARQRVNISLLDDNGQLHIQSAYLALSHKKARLLTQRTRLTPRSFDFMVSAAYRRAIESGEPVIVPSTKLAKELFGETFAWVINSSLHMKDSDLSILVPLKKNGKVIGVLDTTVPELSEKFLPSMQLLAKLMQNNLEHGEALAKEQAQRQEAEKKVAALLEEKTLLLRESHHRVKNNLGTIQAMMTLKANSAKEQEIVLPLVQDLYAQVNAMALLYDKVYCNSISSSVSPANYLQQLVLEILHTFPSGSLLQPEQNYDPHIFLSPKQVSVLGIILTELITNVMKYAFPYPQNEKSLQISLRQEACKEAILTVSDNGVGLPHGFEIEGSSGFGGILLSGLAGQLDGTLTYPPVARGTTVILRFPLELK